MNSDIMKIHSFYFSSRRRHTRLQGDWSSDVCSSDLPPTRMCSSALFQSTSLPSWEFTSLSETLPRLTWSRCTRRSEERRVGKECSTNSWYNKDKKQTLINYGLYNQVS